ncbi:MAG TPA: DegV family protein [Lachnospiraceae bacterium]|nr:DegV family protein [Lachnospiraceae bacterium]
MKKTVIITDSHSSISQSLAQKMGIRVLPMPFYIDDKNYLEGIDLSREDFFRKQASGAKITTSQPSPQDVMNIWDEALLEYEEILYLPITSGLSGSYETAVTLAQSEKYAGRVFVVDHGRISTPLHCMILDALDLISRGIPASEICDKMEHARQNMLIYIAVRTLEYLKKGGRITTAAAAVGSVLNIKPVLKLGSGKLDAFRKARGMIRARKLMIETMQNDIQKYFREAYDKGELYILAATSASEKETASWVKQIEDAFPGHKVMVDYLSLGVSCHTGPDALGIGCSLKLT